jgi:hypothetical protein
MKTYNLIDSWMLTKRWEQEIIQTKREMIAFVKYFQDLLVNLMDDLSIQQIIHHSYIEHCVEMSDYDVQYGPKNPNSDFILKATYQHCGKLCLTFSPKFGGLGTKREQNS